MFEELFINNICMFLVVLYFYIMESNVYSYINLYIKNVILFLFLK